MSITLEPNAVRTVTCAPVPSAVTPVTWPPPMVSWHSSASRSMSHASQTEGSSLSSSYALRRMPAATSSRPRTSSVSEETVPSGSTTAVISPFDSVTRPSSCLVAVAGAAAASEAAARAGAGRHAASSARYWAMAASGSRSAVGSAARRAAHAAWAISLSRLRSRA